MRFTGLRIEKVIFGNNKGEFEGTIYFDLEQGGSIFLKIDDEYSRKFVEVALPLLDKATNEKIEIVRKEIGLSESEVKND